MPELRYTVRARRELINIWLQISEVILAAADDLYNRLEARVEILRRFSESDPVKPDIASEARAHSVIPDGVQIVRGLHGARKIDGTLFAQGLE